MKSISALFKIVSIVLVISLLLCACGITPSTNNNNTNGNNNTTSTGNSSTAVRPENKYTPPSKLMSEKEYLNRVEKLCATKTFTEVDDKFLGNVDDLGNDLRDMITYNQDELKVTGTKYYVSNDGNDKNDGLTPETAWATLDKVNVYTFKTGDAILFERGGFWRGNIKAQSGVTYSAYGKGYKPRISLSIDADTDKWQKTDKKNIWVFDSPILKSVGLVLINEGEHYGELRRESIENLKQNFDFLHATSASGLPGKDCNGRIYMYYDGNNPSDDFWSIEFSVSTSIISIPSGTHDVTLHNLELRHGQDFFFCSNTKNITMKYCSVYWTGGQQDDSGLRYGGGGGCWYGCDTMIFEHCYFYQQFDAGVTPQYNMTDEEPCVFKKFKTKACLFEYCEYPFEYFLTQTTTREEKYVDTYFGYNFVRYTGYGFGDKPTQSACVKSWSAPNPQENFVIEKNIFDRPYVRLLDMGAKTQDGKFDFKLLPKMNNNVYITVKNRGAIRLNEQRFRFNEKGYAELEKIGFETNAVFLFCK